MTSPVDIANRALLAVRAANTLTAIDGTSGGPTGRRVAMLYTPVVRQALSGAWWNFARAAAPLSLLKAQPGTPENPGSATPTWDPKTQPLPPWLYSYAYPDDCVQFQRVLPQMNLDGGNFPVPIFSTPTGPVFEGWYTEAPPIPFQPATDFDSEDPPQSINIVLTNMPQAIGRYTRFIEDPTLWSDNFQEAVVAALAGKLAIPESGDKVMARDQIALANKIMQDARVSDANEGMTVQEHIPDWIQAHGWGGGWCGGLNGWGLFYGPLFTVI